jgi:hypothetical protein
LEVAYVDLILQQFLPPFHFKIEPLQMASGIAIDSHEAVVLSFAYPYNAIQIAAFEEGVEEQLVLGLPMLSAKGAVGEFHIIGWFYVIVGKGEGFVVPGVVGVFVARAEVA